MCRLACLRGLPVRLDTLLYSPGRSLIDQSLQSQLGAEPTNGDGFGVGWYDDSPRPGVFKSIEPAWNDRNLRELAQHTTSRLFIAHLRAVIGSAVQQTNCHPFRHDRWLFAHNGAINEFAKIKRDIAFAVDESLYPEIVGQTDTEHLFYLALTLGLEEDPPEAIARALGLVEDLGYKKGIRYPWQGTIVTTDGERTWLFRYSSEGRSRSLFYTKDVPTLRELYPELEFLGQLSDDARLVVSEPIGDLPGPWIEAPESHFGVLGCGEGGLRPFTVKPPTIAIAVGSAGRAAGGQETAPLGDTRIAREVPTEALRGV
jgi:predicted glutamine amidotransferase